MDERRRTLRDQIRDFNNLVRITATTGATFKFPDTSTDLPWDSAMLIYTPVVSVPTGKAPVRPYAENGAHFIVFTHTGDMLVLRDPGAEMIKGRQRMAPKQFVRLAANLLIYTPDSSNTTRLNYLASMNGTKLWFSEDHAFNMPPIQSAIYSKIDKFTENGTVALLVYQGRIPGTNALGNFPLILMNPSQLYFTTAHLVVEHYHEYWRVYYEFLFDLPEEQRGIYEVLTLPPPSQIERKPPSGRTVEHTKALRLDDTRTVLRKVVVSEDTTKQIDSLHWGGGTYSVKFFGTMNQPIGHTEGEALRDLLESPAMAGKFETFPSAVIPRANSTFPGFDLETYLKDVGVKMWKRPRSMAQIRK